MTEEKKDHEYSMARSQLKTVSNATKRLQKKMGKKGEGELKAWVQSKITKAADYIDTAADYVTNEETITEKRDGKSAKDKGYSLRDWFKGGGWKQAGGKYDGKPCAKQPGQTTKPYCRDADDRASMSKDERNKRAAKKRAEDPNPTRKGQAKIVTQESHSNWRKDLEQLDEFLAGKPGDGYIGHPNLDIKNPLAKKQVKKEVLPGSKGGGAVNRVGAAIGDRGMRYNKMLNQSFEPESELVDEGKKDACYHKVKSRYSVWPSAYASGALVKCRKKGAANWGNSTKKEGYDHSNWRDDFKALQIDSFDIIKTTPLQASDGIGSKMLDEKCWKGYKKKGMKTMFGKRYPNCVKEEGIEQIQEVSAETRSDIKRRFADRKSNKEFKAGGGYAAMDQKGQTADQVRSQGQRNFEPRKFQAPNVHNTKTKGKITYGGSPSMTFSTKSESKNHYDCRSELELEEGAAWTKKSGKNKEGGLNEKGRKSYERENPGSDLKAPSKKKGNKRRASFCARMKGMRKRQKPSNNTGDDRLSKSLRAWNC